MPWKNKEKQRQWQLKWNAANPEKKRAYQLKYRSKNRDLLNQRRAKSRKQNPVKTSELDRRSKLKRSYGITPEQYDQMLVSQHGGCAICSAKPNGSRLHVDHCHNSKLVRGLLCSNCNTFLGLAGEDPARLVNAIFYLTPC